MQVFMYKDMEDLRFRIGKYHKVQRVRLTFQQYSSIQVSFSFDIHLVMLLYQLQMLVNTNDVFREKITRLLPTWQFLSSYAELPVHVSSRLGRKFLWTRSQWVCLRTLCKQRNVYGSCKWLSVSTQSKSHGHPCSWIMCSMFVGN